MNILFASYHCCIRVWKELHVLRQAGYAIATLQASVANDEILNLLPGTHWFGDPGNYATKLKMIMDAGPDIDIIHVHTEPDWLVTVARDVCPNAKIVYDCHDLDSVRFGEATKDERAAFQAADGIIFPSKSYQDAAIASHGIKDKPMAVVYSMVPEKLMPKAPLPRLGGIVYQGGAVAKPTDGITPVGQNYPEYRDYTAIAGQLMQMGIPLTIFGVKPDWQRQYWNTGAITIQPVLYFNMLPQLSRYDWGLLGWNDFHPQWFMAMPNKLFEYLAAGIPVISLNAKECGEFVEAHGVGIAINDLNALAAKDEDTGRQLYHEANRLRQEVWKKRMEFTMESQVEKIEGVYEGVLG